MALVMNGIVGNQKGKRMKTRITVPFEITGWDQVPYAEQDEGPQLARAAVKKTFAGELSGTSTAELLLCSADDAHAGYIAQERVTGRLADREGTFVMQHGGIVDGEEQRPFGRIVPGSATGALAGLRGNVVFMHDAQGARLQLDYEFV